MSTLPSQLIETTTLKHDDTTDGALAILDHFIEARVIDKVPLSC